VLEANSEVLYLSDNVYKPEEESGICWNDKNLNMNWLYRNPTVSDKDLNWPLFQ